MSSANPAGAPNTALPHIEDLNVAIVVAEWNSHITSRLLDGALYVFKNEGYEPDAIDVYNVISDDFLRFFLNFFLNG